MGRTPFYRTSIELEHHFSNIERTRTPYFKLRKLNMEPNKAFTIFTTLLNELTRTSFFRTSNELEHPIFGIERSNIEHCSTHH